MIHVYAFVDGLTGLPGRPGVEGAVLEEIRASGVVAVISRHSAPASGDPRAAAVAHGLVVEALRSAAESVLPARFGESFAGEAELGEAVAASGERIRAALELVRGCVELGVRLTPAGTVVAASSGRAYLEARRAQTSVVSALDERLETFTRAVASGAGERVYLVESASAPAAVEAVHAFAAAHPDVSVVCTGPWAPYSFGEVRA